MQWSDISFEPPVRTLRQFGFICLIVFGAMAALNLLVWSHPRLALGFVLFGVPVGILGLLKPKWVRWIYVGWMVCAFPIGWAVSRIVLALLFFALFTPIGLLFRITGRDALLRRKARQVESYWVTKPMPDDEASYFRQS